MFNKVLIIGLGMIGGSIAMAIKENKLARQVWAADVNKKTLDLAINKQLIDDYILLKNPLLTKISDFDLIIISCPLAKYEFVLNEIIPAVSGRNTIITDIGSLKSFVFDLLTKRNIANNFIATHPIAGSEKMGAKNAIKNLFVNRQIIICKKSSISNGTALKKIAHMWEKLGANIVYLDARKHDKIYALVSHLPQFLSLIIKNNFPLNYQSNNVLLNQAYRLSNSNQKIWQDIFNLNQENLKFFLKKLVKNLQDTNQIIDYCQNRAKLNQLIKIPVDVEIKAKTTAKIIESNFTNFFLQIILITSFLRIDKIKNYTKYSGAGFKDFILPIVIFTKLDVNQSELTSLIAKNKPLILKKIAKLKTIITKYLCKMS